MTTTLGQKIRELRNNRDLSLRELAEKIEVSAPFLSDIELGKRFPSEEVLSALAKELKIKVSDLQEYDQRPPTEDIKALIAKDPSYGFLLRKIVKSDPEALKRFIKNQGL